MDFSVTEETENLTHQLFPYPKFIGKIKKEFEFISKLYEVKRVEVDSKNQHKISYLDYNDPSICFATESILELPLAPKEDQNLFDITLIKNQHSQLKKENRFFECDVNFSETSLKNVPEYKLTIEEKTEIEKGTTRKYWIYLPPNYNETSDQPYPFFLFLDGSDYLSNIPALSILDKMINSKVIPPSIAVFFDYSPDRRLLEYYCDQKFTYFLTHDLIHILQEKHRLPISDDPKLKTIVGFSASGLAALYAGLIYPTIFGNVITQSAALWSVKKSSLENLVDEFFSMKQESCFVMEAGAYENVPLACQFMDGDTQSISINQSNKELVDYMQIKKINASFREFIGGHNYVCWRNSLFDRLKELFEIRHNMINELKNIHGKMK